MEKRCWILGAYTKIQQEGLREVIRQQVELLVRQGIYIFQTGMERGAELLGASVVLQCRETIPQIQLECIIPYEEQAVLWTEQERDLYFSILAECDHEIWIQTRYTPDAVKNVASICLKRINICLQFVMKRQGMKPQSGSNMQENTGRM